MAKTKKNKKSLARVTAELREKLKKLNIKLKETKAKYELSIKTEQAEHKQLLSIFDSIDDPAYVVDPQTYEILFVNKAIKKMFGEVIGKKCYTSFQSLQFPCSFCTNDKIFGKNLGKSYIWDFQNRFNKRWYHCIDKAIRWPDGRFTRFEMAIDITDRKKTEEALQRSNHLFEKALYNLRDAVFVFNTEMDKIIDCNIVATTIFGYSRQEILGLGLADLFDDKEEFDIFKKTLCCTIEEASILGDVNLKMKRKDKTVFSPKCDIMPLGREKGKVMGWVCIIGDIGVKKEK